MALLEVEKAWTEICFRRSSGSRCPRDADEPASIHAPDADIGVPSQVCLAAIGQPPDARCVMVHGKYEHITFIMDPARQLVSVHQNEHG